MFIRSERVFLRPAWPEEAGEVVALRCGGAGVMSNIAPIDRPCGRPVAADRAGTRTPLIDLLITLPSATGTSLIGGIALMRGPEDESPAQLVYWLSQTHWGHGYAAEAARGMLALARMLGHERVVADQSVDDRTSLLVLTRAGFRPTGERRIDGERIAAVYVAEIGDDGANGDDGADEVRAA